MTADVQRIVQHVNAKHDAHYRLLERFSAGEQGAYALEDQLGGKAVLKWLPYPQAIRHYESIKQTTDRLRHSGYPLPRLLLIGADETFSYAIQEMAQGSIVEQLSPTHVEHLIELNRSQLGQALGSNPDWQRNITESVLQGFSDYCVIDTLRSHSQATRSLLDNLQQIVADWDGTPCRTSDVVHYDFHHRNILFNGETVTGVVDWDGCQAGDCVFDLVTLLLYSYDNAPARDLLWSEIRRRSPGPTVRAYIAHMAVRQIDWTIRFYDQASVDRFFDISQRMLKDCAG